MLLSLLTTNLLALLAFFSGYPAATTVTTMPAAASNSNNNLSAHVTAIAREIGGGGGSSRPLPDGLPPELLLFLSPHALPLGRYARTGLTHMRASVAAACLGGMSSSSSALALLSAFMSYAPHAVCPRNATALHLQHRLVSKGCEPLPRRRCLSRGGPRTPLLASTNMGLDHRRWTGPPRHDHKFLIDDVLRLSGASSNKIRISFDVAGGTANFAARMQVGEERHLDTVDTMDALHL